MTSLSSNSPSPISVDLDSTNENSNKLAIVGYACRVPGASNPEQLWTNIADKTDVQQKMSGDRYNVDAFFHTEGTNKGTTNARYGYFLPQDLGNFDAGFFGISGKEAEAMDPQQRILLEVVYEALQEAGITRKDVAGSNTSVFEGSFTNDYSVLMHKDLESYAKYAATGTANSILSNRISYTFDMHGPSMTIDTACSSALIGFHLGCESLRNGESEMSIIVGSALHFDPNMYITTTDLGMLSTDGRCRAFDAKGSGYVRGEGVCAIVVKRMQDAIDHGDPIRSIVRASGSNHDGKKAGITMPNSYAQEALIRSTYARAGLDPNDTTYFEAHGTGTKAGDPRETRAIGAVFGTQEREKPLVIGSIKSNIGHLEGASGLAGLIKTVMMLERRQILPNMHFEDPNPEILFDEWKLRVPTSVESWAEGKGPLRASLNSFGFGGSNAHVVLEEPPKKLQSADSKDQGPIPAHPVFLAISGHTEKTAQQNAQRLAEYLDRNPSTLLSDLSVTLATKRDQHKFRNFVVADNHESAIEKLTELSKSSTWITGRDDVLTRIGFVFTGQGAQHFAMGRELIERSPLFRSTLDRFDAVLQSLPDGIRPEWSTVEELLRDKATSRLGKTAFSQPICTAIQLALVDHLAAWDIKPSATVGHSSGEIGAAYGAGILTFEDAAVVAYLRGLHMSDTSEFAGGKAGGMMAVGMTEEDAKTALKEYEGRVCVACINSSSSLTLAGDLDAISELKDDLDTRKVFARQLQVAQAFHSHHMLPLAPAYENALKQYGIKPRPGKVPMFSSVTARKADWRIMGPAYWAANMTNPVRFEPALVGTLINDSEEQAIDILMEIGPHPALKGPARQIMAAIGYEVPYVGTLVRSTPDYEALVATSAELHARGFAFNAIASSGFPVLDDGHAVVLAPGKMITGLPTYAWEHARYWHETRVIRAHRLRANRHTLLGHPVSIGIDHRPRWRNYLRKSEIPWLVDHKIQGKIIFPAAGYIAMAIEAAVQNYAKSAGGAISVHDVVLRELNIISALGIPETGEVEIMLELESASQSPKELSENWSRFIVCSFTEDDRCIEHCNGLVAVNAGTDSVKPVTKEDISGKISQTNKTTERPAYYSHLTELGLEYGDSFQLISSAVETGDGLAYARLSTASVQALMPSAYDECLLHPAILDSTFHLVFGAVEGALGRLLTEPFVPTSIKSIYVSSELSSTIGDHSGDQAAHLISTASLDGPRKVTGNLQLIAAKGECNPLLTVEGLECTAIGAQGSDDDGRSLFFQVKNLPSFDLLDTEACATLASRGTHLDITVLVDLFAHQRSGKIFIASTSPSLITAALKTLGGTDGYRRRFQSIDILDGGESAALQLEAAYSGLVKTVNAFKGEDYDLIILGEDFEAPNDDAFRALKASGIVIAMSKITSIPGLTQRFDTGSGLTVWGQSGNTPAALSDVVIVMPTNPTPATHKLAASIDKALGQLCPRHTLADIGAASSRTFVSLVSIQETLFNDLTSARDEAAFVGLQRSLMVENNNVVWLLPGASLESSEAEQAPILGMARSANNEIEGLRFLVYDCFRGECDKHLASRIVQLLSSPEEELIERQDRIVLLPRVYPNDVANSKLPNGYGRSQALRQAGANEAFKLKPAPSGSLNDLVWVESTSELAATLAEDEIEIEVLATTVSTSDVAVATGSIDGFSLGHECAGIVRRIGGGVLESEFKSGDRVLALTPGAGAHSTTVRASSSLSWKLGPMPLSDAVSLPVALVTAYIATMELGALKSDESVLIHHAGDALGQMAIQLASRIGAKVFVTVGSPEEKEEVQNLFGLSDLQIFNAHNVKFGEEILKATSGKGVDLVLNRLRGALAQASIACVAKFGRFVELGKHMVGALPTDTAITFASVDLPLLAEYRKESLARSFRECCLLVHGGHVTLPSSIKKFAFTEPTAAYRAVQKGLAIGQVVLSREEGNHPLLVAPPSYEPLSQYFKADKTYLLVGGLGGLGRSLAQWMVRKGARKLSFLSRSGDSKPEARDTVDWLRERGIAVEVFKGDVSQFADTLACIKAIGGDLAGIWHAATVLQDAPLAKLTYRQWTLSLGAKAIGAANLHRATEMCSSNLDYFVCFSSASAIIGTKGQANYAAANAYLDALMRHRREKGLPGATMNCGMIVGIGLVAEDAHLQALMERLGFDPVTEQEFFYQVEEACLNSKGPTFYSDGVPAYQSITGLNLKRNDLYWAERPRFIPMYANNDTAGQSNSSGPKAALATVLKGCASIEERVQELMCAFTEKLSLTLGVAVEKIDQQTPLAAYGLDSLIAVDIRSWFMRTAGVDVALFDVLGSKSILALVQKAASLVTDNTSSAASAEAAVERPEISGKAEAASSSQAETINTRTSDLDGEEIPMSYYQGRLWTVHSMAANKALLNLPIMVRISGTPDYTALQQSLSEMKLRNHILRTAFYEGEEYACQEVLPASDVDLPFFDFSKVESPVEAFRAEIENLKNIELDIEAGEVFRVIYGQLSENKYAMGFVFHHIACDAGSGMPFLKQMSAIYEQLRTGGDLSQLAGPTIQYADFSLWDRQQAESTAAQPHIDYWKRELSNAKQVCALLPCATVKERPAVQVFASAITRTIIAPALIRRMKKVCERCHVTPFHFFFAAFRAFIYLHTKEDDLTISMINGTRPHPDVADSIGFFVNMTPVRSCHDLEESRFEQVLEQVKGDIVSAMEHSSVPFDKIMAAANHKRTMQHSPIAQIVANYQIYGKTADHEFHDFVVDDVHTDDIPSAAELQLEALESAEGLSLRLEYATSIYGDSNAMDRFLENFAEFLSSLARDHRQPIGEAFMCGPKELALQKAQFWNVGIDDTQPWEARTVAEQIISVASRQPDLLAVVDSAGVEVSYLGLSNKALEIAGFLRNSGVGTGSNVAIFASPGASLTVSMVGVLLSGNGYVYLDPTFAKNRLDFIVQDSGAQAILFDDDLRTHELLKTVHPAVSLLRLSDSTNSHGEHLGADNTDHPFYMVYSSGSTGTPKGISLSQSNTHAMLSTLQKMYNFDSTDKFLQQSSVSFDLSVVQTFSALCAGACVLVPTLDTRQDPSKLAQFMVRTQPTVTYFTPTHFTMLLDSGEDLSALTKLKVAFFAGERLPARLVQRFYSMNISATLYNTWSPSEVVVQTTIGKIQAQDALSVDLPIGHPISNCTHYICNAQLQPVPIGIEGEICVGGPQVGGYLNRADLNVVAFPNNPFATDAQLERGWTRLFRTGDKGSFLLDGQLAFRGRIAGDKQVKLRGFRIDLGEVEQLLYTESQKADLDLQIADLSVVAREENAVVDSELDTRQLVAFVVMRRPAVTAVKKRKIAAHLHQLGGQHLNQYMLPSSYHFLDKLPVTIGGKVDRMQLLTLPLLPVRPGQAASAATEPLDASEGSADQRKEVAKLFKSILKLQDNIGPHANFFELGGTSREYASMSSQNGSPLLTSYYATVLLVRLQARLKRKYKNVPTLGEMVKAPTPSRIASLLSQCGSSIQVDRSISWTDEVSLVEDAKFALARSSGMSAMGDTVLLTGVEGYVPLHILVELLRHNPTRAVLVMGTTAASTTDTLVDALETLKLLDTEGGVSKSDLVSRVNHIDGTLSAPRFGMDDVAFKHLAHSVTAIFHCGTEMSLLKTYFDLRPVNVLSTLDIIELAAANSAPIHYLSTWSAPHLRTWSTARQVVAGPENVVDAIAPDHFQPEDNSEHGYFKTRWVSEMILSKAASLHGHKVSIYRPSAAIASTVTEVQAPGGDFVRGMISGMIRKAAVPDAKDGYAIDFVPVDYIASAFVAIASGEYLAPQQREARFYHLNNPAPLALHDLTAIISSIRRDGKAGILLPLPEWHQLEERIQDGESEDAGDAEWAIIRQSVLRAYFDKGHTMHTLDTSSTTQLLERLGARTSCPPVDAALLRFVHERLAHYSDGRL
ncbi:hypothetical protein CF327_g3816 [Tilletia walkeri]|nr:hypothetical protein CF327_g3816 [Tilletia walkeri]